MQKIVSFRVSAGDVATQISDYLTENSTETIVTLTTVNNQGDEQVIALINDGEQSILACGLFCCDFIQKTSVYIIRIIVRYRANMSKIELYTNNNQTLVLS